MPTDAEMQTALDAARVHADNMRADIANATNRFEHLRLTTLSIEAANVVHILEIMASRPEFDRTADNG